MSSVAIQHFLPFFRMLSPICCINPKSARRLSSFVNGSVAAASARLASICARCSCSSRNKTLRSTSSFVRSRMDSSSCVRASRSCVSVPSRSRMLRCRRSLISLNANASRPVGSSAIVWMRASKFPAATCCRRSTRVSSARLTRPANRRANSKDKITAPMKPSSA